MPSYIIGRFAPSGGLPVWGEYPLNPANPDAVAEERYLWGRSEQVDRWWALEAGDGVEWKTVRIDRDGCIELVRTIRNGVPGYIRGGEFEPWDIGVDIVEAPTAEEALREYLSHRLVRKQRIRIQRTRRCQNE